MTPAGRSGPVDAHVHVASDDETRFPRHPTGMASDWWKRDGYEVEAVLGTLTGAGVTQMVAVQAVGAYDDDNRYVLDAADEHPESVRAVVVVDPDAPAAGAAVTELAARPGVAGVRYMAVRPGANWVGTERADEAFESAARSGLTVVLTVFSAQIPLLRPVMDRFPEVPTVLDHCAFPTLEGSVIGRDEPLLGLTALPQVAVKVTSHNLAPLAETGGSRPLVEQLVDCFGADRILWGSDYPQTAHESYADLVELARSALGDLAPAEQAAVLGDNARRLFGFGDRRDGPSGPHRGP
ncbi:MAG: amidohydrolase family protein [Acidimicrobiales bacterium]